MRKYSILSLLNISIRSLLYNILTVGTVLFYAPFCLLFFPFTKLSFRCALAGQWVALNVWLLKKVCRIEYKVEGLQNIPKDRNGVVLSKHQSMWETLYLPLVFKYPAVILKRELLWVPFSGWVLLGVGPISINRKNRAMAREKILEQGKIHLENGRWVLIFPEGTRIPPGHVGDYKMGGARLATHTGYPVLPVAHNAGHCWPRRKFLKHPGIIHLVIGELIESKGKTPEEVLEQSKHWIETTMRRIDPAFKTN